jgi:hypothetical protein
LGEWNANALDGVMVSKGWMLDSGATRHFSPVETDFTALEMFSLPKAVQIGKNNVQVHALGKGIIKVNAMLTLHDVWYLPESPFRIISTNQLTASGHPIVMFDDVACIVKDDNFLGAFTKNACGLLILNDNVMDVVKTFPPSLSLAIEHLRSRSAVAPTSSHANCVIDCMRNDLEGEVSVDASTSKLKNLIEVNNFHSVAEDLHLTSPLLHTSELYHLLPTEKSFWTHQECMPFLRPFVPVGFQTIPTLSEHILSNQICRVARI